LALATVRSAQREGFQVSLVDGGSSEGFKQELTATGLHWHDEEKHGMSGSRRQALEEALKLSGVKILAWTEPEKVSMVQDGIIGRAAEMVSRNEADVVVPCRTPAAWETYGEYQRKSEQEANNKIKKLLVSRGLWKKEDPELDLMVGPRVFKNDPKLVEIFLTKYEFVKEEKNRLQEKIKADNWLNFLFISVAAAIAKGYRVVSMEAEYRHPVAQMQVEENTQGLNQKRDEQRNGILAGMVYVLDKMTGKERNTRGQMEQVPV
jgi:hypothetical protein